MKLKDFKITKQVIKDSKLKSTHSFCELCFRPNPNMDDGYTTCCNELAIDKSSALTEAKGQDVMNFLNTKFSVSSHIKDYGSSYTVFRLDNKKIEFEINTKLDEESIITKVMEKIKGLRKEK